MIIEIIFCVGYMNCSFQYFTTVRLLVTDQVLTAIEKASCKLMPRFDGVTKIITNTLSCGSKVNACMRTAHIVTFIARG